MDDREAIRRLRAAVAAAAPDVELDAPSVRWVETPYPGVRYGLRLGRATALLFLPVEDIDGEGWEDRLPARLREASAYLEQFPLARVPR
ncbi:MAG TPA: hypothetical protein VGR25_03100 [bacterium]|nr:hypothetical protein [bacterium]